MCGSQSLRASDARTSTERGSEAITLAPQNQQSEVAKHSAELAAESPIAHLNNARQILSTIYETVREMEKDGPAFARALVSEPTYVPDLAAALVAIGRRISKAVELLTPAPIRACSNCGTPMIDVQARSILLCVFCGQEEQNGQIVIVGEVPLDVSQLALSQADGYDVTAGDVDEATAAAAIEASRRRFHDSLESRDDP